MSMVRLHMKVKITTVYVFKIRLIFRSYGFEIEWRVRRIRMSAKMNSYEMLKSAYVNTPHPRIYEYVNARSGDMCAPMRTIIVVVVIIVSLISRCWYFTHFIIWREKTFSYYQRFERLRWSECLSTEYLERRKSKFRESFEKNNKQKSVEVVNSC